MGDPAGIGPEICVRWLRENQVGMPCVPIVFGDAGVVSRVSENLRLSESYTTVTHEEFEAAGHDPLRATVVDMQAIRGGDVVPGQVSQATGRAAHRYIEAAIEAAMTQQVDAVVTCPIHKEALRASGSAFPGHTELLAAQTSAKRTCMMLTSDEISCSFVTGHVGLNDVVRLLSAERILDVIELTNEALAQLRQRQARLAVCGLNPHAGEHGLFGDGEEERFITPAIAAAREKGINVEGPLPPDTAFLPDRRLATDCYICMYHDQGLIPLKAIAFDRAVNVTLGLPIIRTSVDHGTALDIAWQGVADLSSFKHAVRLARQLVVNRQARRVEIN
jgi:4-hydroxythreonine-4-phosphate dehydrogenase